MRLTTCKHVHDLYSQSHSAPQAFSIISVRQVGSVNLWLGRPSSNGKVTVLISATPSLYSIHSWPLLLKVCKCTESKWWRFIYYIFFIWRKVYSINTVWHNWCLYWSSDEVLVKLTLQTNWGQQVSTTVIRNWEMHSPAHDSSFFEQTVNLANA